MDRLGVFRRNGFSVDFAVKSEVPNQETPMTIIEAHPSSDEILDFIDSQIQQQRLDGIESRYIVVGRQAYDRLCRAISVREKRGKGRFETYNFIPVVLDPFRTESVCVVPAPAEIAAGVETFTA